MAKNNFIVPKELQKEYKLLVQRANRRVKSNLKYINKERITNEHTRRALVKSFDEPDKWASRTMPFSRSNKGRYVFKNGDKVFEEFKSEKDFELYLNELNRWGQKTKRGEYYETHPQQIRDNYTQSVLKALNQVLDHYSIPTPNGQIPQEIIDALDKLSLEQLTNFYGNGDPSEDMEISQFNSDDFIYVETAEDFTDVVMSRLGQLKRFY